MSSCFVLSFFQECDTNKKDLTAARAELSALGVSAQQGMEAAAKVKTLETEVKRLTEENKMLTENFNSERVQTSFILVVQV